MKLVCACRKDINGKTCVVTLTKSKVRLCTAAPGASAHAFSLGTEPCGRCASGAECALQEEYAGDKAVGSAAGTGVTGRVGLCLILLSWSSINEGDE